MTRSFFSVTVGEHITHTRIVSRLLKIDGITLKLYKCAFFLNRIDYWGHIIRAGRLEVANHTAEANRKLKTPTIVNELRFLFGLCNVFQEIVINSERIASCLSRRLKKTEAKDFGPFQGVQVQALDTVKEDDHITTGTLLFKEHGTIHLSYRWVWRRSRMCSSTGPGRREDILNDRILLPYCHQTGKKPVQYTPRVSRSSLGYPVITTIFGRRKIYNTHRPSRTSLDTESRWCDW